MATLTVDTTHTYETVPDEINEYMTLEATLVAGQGVMIGAAAEKVKAPTNDATADFAGILMTGGVSGDVVQVRRRGVIIIDAFASALAIGDEGTAVYLDTDGTANNNPQDCTKDSTNNMPFGKIQRVITAGTAGTGKCAVRFEADGYTSR